MKEKNNLWLMVLLLTICLVSLPLTVYAITIDQPKTPTGPITGDPPRMPPGGTIRTPSGSAVITVTDGTSPLSGATVSATVGETVLTATTDAAGKATFNRLLPANYTFTATKTGYTSATTGVAVTNGATAAATITLSSTKKYTMSGNVWDMDFGGKEVVGATVSLTNANSAYSAVSDSRGDYTIANVSPGTYQIRVTTTSGYHFVRADIVCWGACSANTTQITITNNTGSCQVQIGGSGNDCAVNFGMHKN